MPYIERERIVNINVKNILFLRRKISVVSIRLIVRIIDKIITTDSCNSLDYYNVKLRATNHECAEDCNIRAGDCFSLSNRVKLYPAILPLSFPFVKNLQRYCTIENAKTLVLLSSRHTYMRDLVEVEKDCIKKARDSNV